MLSWDNLIKPYKSTSERQVLWCMFPCLEGSKILYNSGKTNGISGRREHAQCTLYILYIYYMKMSLCNTASCIMIRHNANVKIKNFIVETIDLDFQ